MWREGRRRRRGEEGERGIDCFFVFGFGFVVVVVGWRFERGSGSLECGAESGVESGVLKWKLKVKCGE